MESVCLVTSPTLHAKDTFADRIILAKPAIRFVKLEDRKGVKVLTDYI